MTSVFQIVSRIEEIGGHVALDVDGGIHYRVPKGNPEVLGLLAELRSRRAEVQELLRRRAFPPETFGGLPDPYAAAMQAAFARISQPEAVGMLRWLGETNLTLYERLTATIPNRLQKLWESRGDLAKFERVLDEWVAAHAAACKAYEIHRFWTE